MNRVNVSVVSQELEGLTDEERRALRASRFNSSSLPPPPVNRSSRLAHPGGPLATNKASALAKFLKRKLEEPGGAASLNPTLVERAVENAKITTRSVALAKVRHVDSFSDLEDEQEENNGKDLSGHEVGTSSSKKIKKKHKVQSNEVGTGSIKKKKKSKVPNNVRLITSKQAKAKGSKKKKKI